jgi:hypothetical protein
MTKFVCESLEELNELYGEGYTSTPTYGEESPEAAVEENPKVEEEVDPKEFAKFVKKTIKDNTPDDVVYKIHDYVSKHPYIHNELGEDYNHVKYVEGADIIRKFWKETFDLKKNEKKKVSPKEFKKYFSDLKKLTNKRAAEAKAGAYFGLYPALYDLQDQEGYREVIEDFRKWRIQ